MSGSTGPVRAKAARRSGRCSSKKGEAVSWPVFGAVTVEDAIFHVGYTVGKRYLSTRVDGVSTTAIASRFRGGDSVRTLAFDYELKPCQIEQALRWELHQRRTRVRMVERVIRKAKR